MPRKKSIDTLMLTHFRDFLQIHGVPYHEYSTLYSTLVNVPGVTTIALEKIQKQEPQITTPQDAAHKWPPQYLPENIRLKVTYDASFSELETSIQTLQGFSPLKITTPKHYASKEPRPLVPHASSTYKFEDGCNAVYIIFTQDQKPTHKNSRSILASHDANRNGSRSNS